MPPDISHLAAIDGEMQQCFQTAHMLRHNQAYWASLADWVKVVGQNGQEEVDEVFESHKVKNLACMFDAGRDFLAYIGLLAVTREVIDREVFARNQREGWPE